MNAAIRRSDSKDKWDISVHGDIAAEFDGSLSEKTTLSGSCAEWLSLCLKKNHHNAYLRNLNGNALELLFYQRFYNHSYLEDWKFELLARQVKSFLSMVFPTVLFWAMIYNDPSSDKKNESYACTCSDGWWCFDLPAFLYATLMILTALGGHTFRSKNLQDKDLSQFAPLVFSKQVVNRKSYFGKHQHIFLTVGIEVGNRKQLMGIWKGGLCTEISSNLSGSMTFAGKSCVYAQR
jgi:hypothetical protein